MREVNRQAFLKRKQSQPERLKQINRDSVTRKRALKKELLADSSSEVKKLKTSSSDNECD